jgi:hypothetical protein
MIVNCDYCGKQVRITKTQASRSEKHFCNDYCYKSDWSTKKRPITKTRQRNLMYKVRMLDIAVIRKEKKIIVTPETFKYWATNGVDQSVKNLQWEFGFKLNLKTEMKQKQFYKDRRGSHNAKPVLYDGQKFPSMEELSRELKISPQRLRWHLRNDKPLYGNYLDYAIGES